MISIIVPVYKVEPYLRQCVNSLLNQTYHDIEVLLIDDGSPDRCGEICDEYAEKDKRVRVFHTENRGLSAARNLGLREAKGQYIGFVDSDDWIEPDMYEVLLRRMEETRADISVCGFWTESNKAEPLQQEVFIGQEILIALLDQRLNNCVWNKLYKKALFDGVAFPYGKNFEDISKMHVILSRSQRAVVIPAQKYHYQKRSMSITRDYKAKNLIDYADAHLARFYYYREEHGQLFLEMEDDVLFVAAKGISRVWRWWYGCSAEDKIIYQAKIKELRDFSRENFPLFGYGTWPCFLRLTSVFMYSSDFMVFSMLYGMNQIYRKIKQMRLNNTITG